MRDKLAPLKESLSHLPAQDVIAHVYKELGKDLVLASSLGPEDQVLTHMALMADPQARIFVIDTGRLPAETYAVMQRMVDTYKLSYEVYFPEAQEVEEMVSAHGPNLFYQSVANRKQCCESRKVKPLRRALSGAKAWITGQRKAQSVTRAHLDLVEWDEANDMIKLNPLADWTEDQVWAYIKENNIPYNTLHDEGYPSIGCAPCTRAIKEGEDVRAGRWWWEAPEHKECGLHNRPKKD